MPTTSIYSKNDSDVAWCGSVNDHSPLTENIKVQASHIGLGVNPIAREALTDRLDQPEGEWKPCARKGARLWFYRT